MRRCAEKGEEQCVKAYFLLQSRYYFGSTAFAQEDKGYKDDTISVKAYRLKLGKQAQSGMGGNRIFLSLEGFILPINLPTVLFR